MSKRLIAASVVAALFSTMLPATAGTTGSLKGRVTDSATGAPIAGASVAAVSASQSVTATTDSSGGFIFLSLAPDTYTVTASKTGYDSQSQPGETIQADQSSTLSLALTKSLKTIAVTHSRSTADLVRSGTTSDVYSVNAAAQKATKALGGSGSLDQAYGAIASVPGVSIPTGQQGWYQSVFIRGGDYDQVAYEFDGIPVIRESDGAPIVTLSNLGQQEVQVYTGGTPATSNSPGLAGYINQVIKTGTNPGYAQSSIGVGTPTFYHKLSVEAGGASPDRLFSYYVGLAGDDQSYRYGDQFNGVSDPLYYYPLTIPTANLAGYNILDGSCGDPSLMTPCPGPNYGAQFSPGASWVQSYNADRETVMNFHFGLPHKHDSGKDDIQMLYVTGNIATQYYSSANDLETSQMSYLDANVGSGGGYYTGPVFQAPNPNDFTNASFPSQPPGTFDSTIGLNQRDGGSNGYSIEKLQYQRNINDRSYLRAIGYSEYTNWFLNGPNSANQLFGATLADYEVIGEFFGGSLIYSNALSDKHLLTASASYETQKLQTYNATFDTTYGGSTGQFGSNIADLTNGTNCFDPGTGAYTSCYGSAVSVISAGSVPTPAYTCPNGSPACAANAQYLVTENGQNAQVDNVTPNFSSLAVTDVYRPDDRWTWNIGARFDHFAYTLDNLESSYPARAFWFTAYNNEHCWATGVSDISITGFNAGGVGQCPAGYTLRATSNPFVDSTGGNPSQNVFQPRVAFTFAQNQYTVWRGSFGVYARPAATSYQEYNTYQQDLPSFLSQFSALGYTSPVHDVRADTSDNFDLSYEHHVPGTALTLKASPFYRTTNNQLQYLNISALGGTLAGINVGTLTSYGLELALQYGDYSKDGWSGQLSYTYTNTHTRYKALPNGLNIIDVMNESIEQYNSYTSACAANENTKQCGNGLYAGNGAASFNNGGVVVQNPYYSSAAQPLMDPNASYVPYDVIPSAFASANSYAVPDVATLVVNWKHQKLTITPSLAFTSGSYYGSPLSVPGYVPQSCTQSPSLTPTTPGVSCDSGAPLFVPDPYTGHFDSLGSLKEPWQLTGNLQISYDLNPRMTITVLANNIFNKCYQHGYAWDTPTACWYSSLPSNILPPNGPGTQPGAFLTTPPVQLAYPYGIWFNNTQVGITSARQPFQLTANLDIKL
jgi:hypothetical protein